MHLVGLHAKLCCHTSFVAGHAMTALGIDHDICTVLAVTRNRLLETGDCSIIDVLCNLVAMYAPISQPDWPLLGRVAKPVVAYVRSVHQKLL